jgi:hypothetical protein
MQEVFEHAISRFDALQARGCEFACRTTCVCRKCLKGMHFQGIPACEVRYGCPALRWLYVAAQGDVRSVQIYNQLDALAISGLGIGSGTGEHPVVVMSVGAGPGWTS